MECSMRCSMECSAVEAQRAFEEHAARVEEQRVLLQGPTLPVRDVLDAMESRRGTRHTTAVPQLFLGHNCTGHNYKQWSLAATRAHVHVCVCVWCRAVNDGVPCVQVIAQLREVEGTCSLLRLAGCSSAIDAELKPPPKKKQKQCAHGRREYNCRECGGGGTCAHSSQKYACKECGGSSICPHRRRKRDCKECGGSQARLHHIVMALHSYGLY